METWNSIIKKPESPERRLFDLLGLWADIIEMYYDPMIMYFETKEYKAVMDPSYNRILYPSATASVIKTNNTDQVSFNDDKNLKYITEDECNYRLVKGLSAIFNRTLNKEEREAIVRKYFYKEACSKTSLHFNMSKSTYYRTLKKAKNLLIMNYCLDHYNEDGVEKKNWLEVCDSRRKWNNGHFFQEDIRAWPEFQQIQERGNGI